jgi:hypothetical protein
MPAYMGPEQAEGDLGHLDPRPDVYSLGGTLYCPLAGRPRVEGDILQVIRAVQMGAFPPPRSPTVGDRNAPRPPPRAVAGGAQVATKRPRRSAAR